jgi:hypothetical protein
MGIWRPVDEKRKRRVITAAIVVAALVALWSGFCFWRAATAGNRAKSALVAAEASLQKRDIPATRRHLAEANAALDGVDSYLGRLGPLRTIMQRTPIVRVQLHGVEAYAGAGRDLTRGAGVLTEALDAVLHPKDPNASLETTLEPLRNFDAALQQGISSLDASLAKLQTLDGERLLGPLDSVRHDLGRRLSDAQQRATEGERGVKALLTVMGGDGPRRFLVLAQNPDEVRPTGGYTGSYGVLTSDGAKVHLDRFEGAENWNTAHPDVFVPPDQEDSPFKFVENPVPQHLSNANATIDWPSGAQLAERLWAQGGEAPVNGVLLITPDLLVRVLSVLGPVQVPEYNETVTAQNLLERLDFYTHHLAASDQPGGAAAGRKEFLSALAEPVLHAMIHSPSSKWVDLGQKLGEAFDAREAMAWSDDAKVEDVLTERGWDGRIPDVESDFVANADFEYDAKNGRGLTRTFDHVVQINADGSGTVTTTMKLDDTLPPDPNTGGKFNDGASMYETFYGPAGATLDANSGNDPHFIAKEPAVSNHPAAGFLLFAPPLGSDTVTLSWRVPKLIVRDTHGQWRYSLFWRSVPTNRADTLHVQVQLPSGWQWAGQAPAAEIRLDHDVNMSWAIQPNSR